MRLALALVALLGTPDLASARCARPVVGSAVMTPAGATVASDGGVLVQTTIAFDGAAVGSETAVNPTWRFSNGTSSLTPTLETLAPGLVVYHPPAKTSGALSLVDGKTTRGKVSFTAGKTAMLAAPEPRTVKLVTTRALRGGILQRIDATFTAAAPTGAVAVVVYGVTKQGNVARSWMQVTAGATTAVVAGTASRCNPGIPGEIISAVGDRVVLAWVDESGRVSKLSAPVTVAK